MTAGLFILSVFLASLNLNANVDQSSLPISFRQLKPNQEISFHASSWSSLGILNFSVEVYSRPVPKAIIVLEVNATLLVDAAEKLWKHRIGERVEKKLADADLTSLEVFLDSYRANGAQENRAVSLPASREFSLSERSTEGILVLKRKEEYKLSAEGDAKFIKEFIGFDPTKFEPKVAGETTPNVVH